MARVYADNVVLLMRPGEAARRRGVREAVSKTSIVAATVLAYRPATTPATAGAATRTRRTTARGMALLVMLALVLPAALGFGWSLWHQLAGQEITASPSARHFALPGGSTVWLDQSARMAVVAGTPDAVRLQQGRVRFDLAGLPGLPLRVQASDGVIVARGGQLQVDRTGQTVRVTTTNGTATVSLPASGARVVLQPGQQVAYGYDRLGQVQAATR